MSCTEYYVTNVTCNGRTCISGLLLFGNKGLCSELVAQSKLAEAKALMPVADRLIAYTAFHRPVHGGLNSGSLSHYTRSS